MQQKLQQFIEIVKRDSAVDTVGGSSAGFSGATNIASVFVALKPLNERKLSAKQVIERLRGRLAAVAGATLFLQSVGDIGAGGRSANAAERVDAETRRRAAIRSRPVRCQQ
jgi:multidrug efflux pump